jgi:DNA-binding NarL/FixJ family response regulator
MVQVLPLHPMRVSTVLILDSDPFSSRVLHERVQWIYPQADCVVVSNIVRAALILSSSHVDLLVTSLDITDGDVLNLLLHLKRLGRAPSRTVVTTHVRGVRVLLTLRRLEVAVVFNPREETLERLAAVLAAIDRDQVYWSECFVTALVSNDALVVARQMSPTEQLALAVMGDGCSDKVATERMGMSLLSVRSLRKRLYSKLKVHDREGLQRTATRLSFTRVSDEGTVPMGAAILILEYMERCKRPVTLPTQVLEQFGFTSDGSTCGSVPPYSRVG